MKRSTRLGSIAAAVVGTIALAAWLVKERLTGPAPAGEAKPLAVAPPPPPPPPKPKAEAKPKPKAAAPKPKAAPASGDDLAEIDGIGPVYKTRLAEAGITTFAALGAADAAGIAEQIQAPVSRIQAWVDAARRRA